MGARTDGALAVVVLTAALVAFVLVGATPSLPAFLLGAAATVGFELVAARDPETVRKYWERRPVQFAAVVVALAIVGVGTTVAPSSVLSAISGALVMYLAFLMVVVAGS
ncbi:hypothetical protein [Natrialba sp. INN-245]|uniref:hypothetical protein n=1 Tax=Natrialba sp. INN-245 TaxID=2690967 RepID=UPI0013128FE3|nr:hypothetical protein [Natrialba sp. INN-245]MWV40764.1 hypothetical protein [Natrialba sp. INN-245]